jgi:hypothetical protein
VSKTSTGGERISEILFEFDKSQYELKRDMEKSTHSWRWPFWFAIVSILLAIVLFFILLAFGAEFIPPVIKTALDISIIVLVLISYVMFLLNQYGLRGPNRRSVRGSSSSSIGVVLRNVKLMDKVNLQYIPELTKNDIHDLEDTLLEVKSQRVFIDRRLALVVGAIDKVGILPGFVALPSFFKDSGTWNWVNALVLIVPVIYALALAGNDLLMRLDRMIKLLELSIQRKNAEESLQKAT